MPVSDRDCNPNELPMARNQPRAPPRPAHRAATQSRLVEVARLEALFRGERPTSDRPQPARRSLLGGQVGSYLFLRVDELNLNHEF